MSIDEWRRLLKLQTRALMRVNSRKHGMDLVNARGLQLRGSPKAGDSALSATMGMPPFMD
jgi:hypothetical protein